MGFMQTKVYSDWWKKTELCLFLEWLYTLAASVLTPFWVLCASVCVTHSQLLSEHSLVSMCANDLSPQGYIKICSQRDQHCPHHGWNLSFCQSLTSLYLTHTHVLLNILWNIDLPWAPWSERKFEKDTEDVFQNLVTWLPRLLGIIGMFRLTRLKSDTLRHISQTFTGMLKSKCSKKTESKCSNNSMGLTAWSRGSESDVWWSEWGVCENELTVMCLWGWDG